MERERYPDAGDATCKFDQRIPRLAVPVRRQMLQHLQPDCRPPNERQDKPEMAGISETEQKAHECECAEALKADAAKMRPQTDR